MTRTIQFTQVTKSLPGLKIVDPTLENCKGALCEIPRRALDFTSTLLVINPNMTVGARTATNKYSDECFKWLDDAEHDLWEHLLSRFENFFHAACTHMSNPWSVQFTNRLGSKFCPTPTSASVTMPAPNTDGAPQSIDKCIDVLASLKTLGLAGILGPEPSTRIDETIATRKHHLEHVKAAFSMLSSAARKEAALDIRTPVLRVMAGSLACMTAYNIPWYGEAFLQFREQVIKLHNAALSDKPTGPIAGYNGFAIRLNDVFIHYETPEAEAIACNNFVDADFKEDVVGPVTEMSPTMRLDSLCQYHQNLLGTEWAIVGGELAANTIGGIILAQAILILASAWCRRTLFTQKGSRGSRTTCRGSESCAPLGSFKHSHATPSPRSRMVTERPSSKPSITGGWARISSTPARNF